MVKTPSSNAEGMGSIPGTKIPHPASRAVWPKIFLKSLVILSSVEVVLLGGKCESI